MYASFYIKKVWLQVKAISRAAAAGLAEQSDGVRRKEILQIPGRRCFGGFCDVGVLAGVHPALKATRALFEHSADHFCLAFAQPLKSITRPVHSLFDFNRIGQFSGFACYYSALSRACCQFGPVYLNRG
jgi:hypothetical protein